MKIFSNTNYLFQYHSNPFSFAFRDEIMYNVCTTYKRQIFTTRSKRYISFRYKKKPPEGGEKGRNLATTTLLHIAVHNSSPYRRNRRSKSANHKTSISLTKRGSPFPRYHSLHYSQAGNRSRHLTID